MAEDPGIAADPVGYQARLRPGKTAVVELATGTALSYRALDEAAARAAGWLVRRLGDPLGRRVAMLGRNGIALLVLSLACQRAGAIFVPLNWRLAAAELADLLADCTPDLIVADDEFSGHLAGAVNVLATNDFSVTAAVSEPHPGVTSEPATPIVLLYTSGTTGRPKGVIVTAENALFAALNFAFVGEVGAGAVAFSDLPMFHTIGLIAVARTTLMMGGTLVLTDRFSPARSLEALADRGLGITHYFAVPVMAEALVRERDFAAAAFAGLHAIFVGGAPLVPALIERYLEIGVPLVNGYGMSEAGTAIHVPIDRDAVRDSGGAVGLPAPFTAVRLVRDGQDVAAGEIGEIWLQGKAVSPGYWGRPEESAAAFGDGWYRTGDLARLDERGFYSVVDRLKDMYVSGGENVYPAEVEAALTAHPAVADAAVLGVADARWGETGIAFVVPRAAAAFDAEELRGFCLGRLARYKCPARFIEIAAVPRSAAGKVLKSKLRQQLNQGESR